MIQVASFIEKQYNLSKNGYMCAAQIDRFLNVGDNFITQAPVFMCHLLWDFP